MHAGAGYVRRHWLDGPVMVPMLPALHWQVVTAVAPSARVLVPSGQAKQEPTVTWPVNGPYVPIGQSDHAKRRR